MLKLNELQSRFMDYLLHADESIAEEIASDTSHERARRLSIYFNAYRIRLRGSMEIDHPVLGIYLGDEGFEQMVTAYINAQPSTQTSLRHFCDRLPDFLRQHSPYQEIGELAPLAEFERMLMDVFDAADSPVDSMDSLISLPPEQWPSMRLDFHPSVRIYQTPWNCVEIWRAIKAGEAPPQASQGDSQAWLLWRNTERLSEFRSLPMDEYVTLEHALRGVAFAGICEALLEWHEEHEVAQRAFALLNIWLSTGLIASVGTDNLTGPDC
jgi:hypothetical protein